MAKKMNRKLTKYKHGSLPEMENNSWSESDWHKELDDLVDRDRNALRKI